MQEDRSYVIDRMDKARPVVLKGIHKGAEALVDPLISVLSLAVCLQVVGCRQLELCTKKTAKLFLKGRYKL